MNGLNLRKNETNIEINKEMVQSLQNQYGINVKLRFTRHYNYFYWIRIYLNTILLIRPDKHVSFICNYRDLFFNGYIGLEADRNFKVKPLPQKDTFQPQHRLYKLTYSDVHQNRSTCSILQYMVDNNINLSTLDWGGRKKTDFDGSLLTRNSK